MPREPIYISVIFDINLATESFFKSISVNLAIVNAVFQLLKLGPRRSYHLSILLLRELLFSKFWNKTAGHIVLVLILVYLLIN